MAIPTLLARLAAGVAEEALASEDAAAGFTELASQLGGTYSEEDGITIPVDSTAITAIGFRNDTITTVFKRGGSLAYDVPGSLEEFIAYAFSPSKGQFYNSNLRNR